MKIIKNISIDPLVWASFESLCNVRNFSAWVEKHMEEEIASTETKFRCEVCKFPACSVQAWKAWNWRCPNCGNENRDAIHVVEKESTPEPPKEKEVKP